MDILSNAQGCSDVMHVRVGERNGPGGSSPRLALLDHLNLWERTDLPALTDCAAARASLCLHSPLGRQYAADASSHFLEILSSIVPSSRSILSGARCGSLLPCAVSYMASCAMYICSLCLLTRGLPLMLIPLPEPASRASISRSSTKQPVRTPTCVASIINHVVR